MALGLTRFGLEEEIRKIAPSGGSGSPTGAAGGSLAGGYPNPGLAAGVATGNVLGSDVVTTATALVGDVAGPVGATAIGVGKVLSAMLGAGAVTTAKLAAGAATGAALGSDVATRVLGIVPISQLATGTPTGSKFIRDDGTLAVPAASSLAGLTDAAITAPGVSQSLFYDGVHWANQRLVYWAPAYGAKIDGTTDDTAAWNAASLAANSAGCGIVAGAPLSSRRSVVNGFLNIYSNLTYDGFGVELFKKANAASGAHMLLSVGAPANFATSTRPGTQNSGTIGTTIRNFELNGNKANQTQALFNLAIYGAGCKFQHIKSHDAPAGDWFDYNPTSQADLGGLGVGNGDHWHVIEDFESFNHGTGITCPSQDDWAAVMDVTGVTNTVNPTITTRTAHHLAAGVSVVIAGVGGATGVNGTFTVLASAANNTFTVTTGAPGAYTSGGSVTYTHHVTAFLTLLGPQNINLSNIKMFNTGGTVLGQRGVLNGQSCAGTVANRIHIYQNFDVGWDNHGSQSSLKDCYIGGMNVQLLDRSPTGDFSGTLQTSFAHGVGLYVASSLSTYALQIQQLGAAAVYVQLVNGGFMNGSRFGVTCYDGGAAGKYLYTGTFPAPPGTRGGIINADPTGITLGGSDGAGAGVWN